MKKISFKNLYICKKCKRKIVGYTAYCPICNQKVEKLDEKIIIFTKGNK